MKYMKHYHTFDAHLALLSYLVIDSFFRALYLSKDKDYAKYKIPIMNMKGIKVLRKMKGTEVTNKNRNPNKKKRKWWHIIKIIADNEKFTQGQVV